MLYDVMTSIVSEAEYNVQIISFLVDRFHLTKENIMTGRNIMWEVFMWEQWGLLRYLVNKLNLTSSDLLCNIATLVLMDSLDGLQEVKKIVPFTFTLSQITREIKSQGSSVKKNLSTYQYLITKIRLN